MALLASSGEPKLRSGRFDIVFWKADRRLRNGRLRVVTACEPGRRSASARPVAAEKGMVVTAQHLATHVGVDILKARRQCDRRCRRGRICPGSGLSGRRQFGRRRLHDDPLADGRKTFLDFREKAPGAARRDMYLDKDGNVIKGLTTLGWLAVGVPGTVSGLEYARKKYGT